MDFIEYRQGLTKDYFWFKANNNLLDILVQSLNKQNLKILNIGSGIGGELEILNKYGDVYIIDINKNSLKLISKHLIHEKKLCDVCTISYPNNFFDLVISFDVFEHVNDDKKAVAEIKRILKPDGLLIFSVPAFQILFSNHDKALNHKRRYTIKIIKRLFKDFNQVRLGYWNFFLFLPVAIGRLINKNSKPGLNGKNLSGVINSLLYRLLQFENFLIKKKINFPIGLSIYGLYKKP